MTTDSELICNATLRAHVAARLEAFERISQPVDDAHHAAVALALVESGHGADLEGLPRYDRWQPHAALLLTRRALTLRKHAGQWALPGGRLDPGETPEQAALRELAEEVGLHLGSGDLLGTLDDFTTHSGFVMTPVVVWGGAARKLTPNPGEVRSIHRVPLSELLRSDAPALETLGDAAEPVLRMPVGDGSIAAPTAALLFQFREVVLRGRHTRVAHYEQPYFARH